MDSTPAVVYISSANKKKLIHDSCLTESLGDRVTSIDYAKHFEENVYTYSILFLLTLVKATCVCYVQILIYIGLCCILFRMHCVFSCFVSTSGCEERQFDGLILKSQDYI